MWGIPIVHKTLNRSKKRTRVGLKVLAFLLFIAIDLATYGAEGVIGKSYSAVFIPASYYVIILFYYIGFIAFGGAVLKIRKSPLSFPLKCGLVLASVAWTFVAFLIYGSIQRMPMTVNP